MGPSKYLVLILCYFYSQTLKDRCQLNTPKNPVYLKSWILQHHTLPKATWGATSSPNSSRPILTLWIMQTNFVKLCRSLQRKQEPRFFLPTSISSSHMVSRVSLSSKKVISAFTLGPSLATPPLIFSRAETLSTPGSLSSHWKLSSRRKTLIA